MHTVPLQEIEATFVKFVDDEDSSTGSNFTGVLFFCDNCLISCMRTKHNDPCSTTMIIIVPPVSAHLLVTFPSHYVQFSHNF